jgi:hypothetical protein
MNRTRGFVNQNRFKSGKAVKRLSKVTDDRRMKKASRKGRATEKTPVIHGFGA